MKKALKTLSAVLCVILAFSAVSIGASAKAKKYVKSIKVTKKATITIPASSSTAKKSFKVTVKTKGKASKKFTAKSANSSVASVKVSGKNIVVTAKKAGTAKITVKTKGKSKKNKKLSAKLTVTVKKNKPAKANNYNPNYVPPKPGTTPKPSNPSTPAANYTQNYDKLKTYLMTYGDEDIEGDYYIREKYTIDDTVFDCTIYYLVNDNKFLFMSLNSLDNYDDYDDYEGYCDYWTTMTLAYGGSSSTVAFWEGEKYDYDYSEDEHYEDEDWAFGSIATLNPSTFSKNSELYFSLNYGEASSDYINGYGNSDLQCSMIGWQKILNGYNLNFSDLGFVNYN